MVNPDGQIQDLLTDFNPDEYYVEGANDFEEITVIENDDITILNDVSSLWQGILSILKTPTGVIDGVGLENFGSRLLSLRGATLDWHMKELAKLYIREDVINQTQGYVLDIPKIEITQPSSLEVTRHNIRIYMEVESIFGPFTRTFWI